MKIAIVHDQLQEFGGAERVLVALKKIYPGAHVFTSFYNYNSLGIHKNEFDGWDIKTSWADKIPFLKKFYSPLRFITPLIWESFDFSAYNLIISSSGSYMSKGIITKPKTLHICYLHHPPRYLYNYETAIEWQKYWPIKIYGNLINHNLRIWDYLSSQRPSYFIANSEETKKRIAKFYRRDSTVIYPPVNLAKQSTSEQPKQKNYYLTISRLARAKHIDLLVKASNKNGFQLKIVGSGRDAQYLKSLAGKNVELLGSISDDKLDKLYQGAKAFLFAGVDEEFGIAPIEAMSQGLPIIAYSSGGLKETVANGQNGFLYEALNEDALLNKINLIEKMPKKQYQEMSNKAKESAQKYSFNEFKEQISNFIASKLS